MKSFKPSKSLLLTLGIMATHQAAAQTDENAPEGDIEEVVVTGSFIRNSQFTNASPIETISTDDIWQSGAANLGEYIRDLPYMENIDTVANILDTPGGQQRVGLPACCRVSHRNALRSLPTAVRRFMAPTQLLVWPISFRTRNMKAFARVSTTSGMNVAVPNRVPWS